jgi:ribosomal protein S18 acetylase RimI-like enzyme
MFRVRTMKQDDFTFAVELANTMDWGMAEEDFEFNSRMEPEGCFVLLDDVKHVGICTCVGYGKVGWFGNLIVQENCRRKGAGSFLLRRSIEFLKRKRVETIGLYAYPRLIRFYERFGFKPDEQFLVMKKQAALPEETMEAKKASVSDVPDIVSIDGQCFGANRSRLLKNLLSKKNNQCYVSVAEHEIVGFVAAKVYADMAEVGPLGCLDKYQDATLKLLETQLANLKGLEVSVYVPEKQAAILNLLNNSGFREDFRLVRMFLGSAVGKNCLYLAESLERG